MKTKSGLQIQKNTFSEDGFWKSAALAWLSQLLKFHISFGNAPLRFVSKFKLGSFFQNCGANPIIFAFWVYTSPFRVVLIITQRSNFFRFTLLRMYYFVFVSEKVCSWEREDSLGVRCPPTFGVCLRVLLDCGLRPHLGWYWHSQRLFENVVQPRPLIRRVHRPSLKWAVSHVKTPVWWKKVCQTEFLQMTVWKSYRLPYWLVNWHGLFWCV